MKRLLARPFLIDVLVARLRDHHQGNNKILFSTDMTSGHGGASGRYSRYRDHAMAMSFAAYLAENDL